MRGCCGDAATGRSTQRIESRHRDRRPAQPASDCATV